MESYPAAGQHGYMRPPVAPPSTASDPQFHHQQHPYQQYPPPPPPPPSQSTTTSWHPSHFQYSPSPPPPPPPPPPHHTQWAPPPPPPPPPSYPTHHHQQPYPPPYSTQVWGNGNWNHHTGWEYPPAYSNEEDWAAKAKAWASARSAMDIQQPQSQYTSATRHEDPSPYANQYSQPADSHFQDLQQASAPTSGFSSYQGPVGPLHRPPAVHQQEPGSAPVGSYTSESHFSYANLQGQTNSSVHQQEVPSSYSSIPGNEDGSRGKQHGNSLLPADDRAMPVDHAQFAYGNHSLEPMDQPLDFASRFSHGNDPNMLSSYPDSSQLARGTDSVSDMSSSHSWTAPVAPSASYLPIAPAFPSAIQHDYVGRPPLPGQLLPLFGTGAGFQPQVPTHVSLTAGMALHPAATFPIDAYGVPLSSERPKKAAVPDWLREEIIKTKATIATSAPEHFKERAEFIGEELIDNPIGRGDQSDNKSMDSARSTEEDEDEDEEDAQRTAAINQEIKRVLTEVLLKVTDELFDEIATKVLSEDDYTANAVVSDNSVPVSKVSPSPPPPVSASKASAKVVIPSKAKKSKEHASGETSSGSAGNVLGLANYASDEDDGIQASSIPKFDSSGPGDAREKGPVQIEAGEHRKNTAYTGIDNNNGRPIGVHADHGLLASKLNDHEVSKDPANSGDDAKSTNNGHKETLNKPDSSTKILNLRMSDTDNSLERGAKRHERHDSKRSSSGRDNCKETNSNKEMEGEKDEIFNRRDEKHKKDKIEDSNKRERERDNKERSPRHVEKARESSSRRRSPHREGKDSRYESHRDKKRSSKDDVDKKRERTKEEKTDKSRHKSSETSRHKRRHSSPLGGRSKPIKGSPILTDDSSDESSEDSRRRNHSKKRNLSPSPDRSRRRDKRSRSRSRSPVRRHRR